MTGITSSSGLTMDAVKQLFGATDPMARKTQAGLPVGGNAPVVSTRPSGPQDGPGGILDSRFAKLLSNPEEEPRSQREKALARDAQLQVAFLHARLAASAASALDGLLGAPPTDATAAATPEDVPEGAMRVHRDPEAFRQSMIAGLTENFQRFTGKAPAIETLDDGRQRVARTDAEQTYRWGEAESESFLLRLSVGGGEDAEISILDNSTGAGSTYAYSPARGDERPERALLLDTWA